MDGRKVYSRASFTHWGKWVLWCGRGFLMLLNPQHNIRRHLCIKAFLWEHCAKAAHKKQNYGPHIHGNASQTVGLYTRTQILIKVKITAFEEHFKDLKNYTMLLNNNIWYGGHPENTSNIFKNSKSSWLSPSTGDLISDSWYPVSVRHRYTCPSCRILHAYHLWTLTY